MGMHVTIRRTAFRRILIAARQTIESRQKRLEQTRGTIRQSEYVMEAAEYAQDLKFLDTLFNSSQVDVTEY